MSTARTVGVPLDAGTLFRDSIVSGGYEVRMNSRLSTPEGHGPFGIDASERRTEISLE